MPIDYFIITNDYYAHHRRKRRQLPILPRILQIVSRQNSPTHTTQRTIQRKKLTHQSLRQTRKKRRRNQQRRKNRRRPQKKIQKNSQRNRKTLPLLHRNLPKIIRIRRIPQSTHKNQTPRTIYRTRPRQRPLRSKHDVLHEGLRTYLIQYHCFIIDCSLSLLSYR